MFTDAQSLPVLGDTRLHFGLIFALAAVVVCTDDSLYQMGLRAAHHRRESGGSKKCRHSNQQTYSVGYGHQRRIGRPCRNERGCRCHSPSHVWNITGYGYTAIIVAWLAKLNPVGLIVASVSIRRTDRRRIQFQTIGLPSSHLKYAARRNPICPHCREYVQ